MTSILGRPRGWSNLPSARPLTPLGEGCPGKIDSNKGTVSLTSLLGPSSGPSYFWYQGGRRRHTHSHFGALNTYGDSICPRGLKSWLPPPQPRPHCVLLRVAAQLFCCVPRGGCLFACVRLEVCRTVGFDWNTIATRATSIATCDSKLVELRPSDGMLGSISLSQGWGKAWPLLNSCCSAQHSFDWGGDSAVCRGLVPLFGELTPLRDHPHPDLNVGGIHAFIKRLCHNMVLVGKHFTFLLVVV